MTTTILHPLTVTDREKKFVPKPPTDELIDDYDLPERIARCLVGKTERETDGNCEAMRDYIRYVVERCRERCGC